MTGSKAEALDLFCAARNTPFLRFDYSGHGASGGRFEDGCISDWAADAAHLVAHLTTGPQGSFVAGTEGATLRLHDGSALELDPEAGFDFLLDDVVHIEPPGPPCGNSSTKRVYIPTNQLLTPDTLRQLLAAELHLITTEIGAEDFFSLPPNRKWQVSQH